MTKKSIDTLWERVNGIKRSLEIREHEAKKLLERIEQVQQGVIGKDRFYDITNELRNKVEKLEQWQVSEQGVDKGKDKLAGYLPWIIAAVAALTAIIATFKK